MDLNLIIALISGVIGGNVAGKAVPKIDQGMLVNSISGIVGGGLGGSILSMLGAGGMAEGGMDIGSIIGQVASGGVGGGVVMAVLGVLRGMMKK
jgi:uncharacterized membrane protein YeaQ/YmgE (transglycosylase-associated protein family)